MIYDPQPILTNGIELPESLTPLIEKLAESVHDNWAIVRIDQGWTYGQIRDDNVKTHPALVPYAELSESEKDVDRRIVVQTLKSIYAFGYDIVRVS